MAVYVDFIYRRLNISSGKREHEEETDCEQNERGMRKGLLFVRDKQKHVNSYNIHFSVITISK